MNKRMVVIMTTLVSTSFLKYTASHSDVYTEKRDKRSFGSEPVKPLL